MIAEPVVGTRAKIWFLAGLFLVSMCGLMLQILETRVISVIGQYHLAFMAISMAMFGMTAGSLAVYFRPALFDAKRLFENLVWACSAFGIAIVGSTLLLITTVVVTGGGAEAVLILSLLWYKLILILAAPYVFRGIAVALALTRGPWPVPLVYGCDLLGAAFGCLAVLAVMNWMDGVSALLLVGALAAAGAACFKRAHAAAGAAAPPFALAARLPRLFRPAPLALALAALALGNAAIQPYGLKLTVVKGQIEDPNGVLVRWNSFSRISVSPSLTGPAQLWDPAPGVALPTRENRHLAIDGSAGSDLYRFDGDLGELGFLKYDITSLAYTIRHQGRAAIIGVGGGRDVLAAEHFGFRDVTGIELNPIFIDLLRHRFADYNKVASVPGVRLVADEARSWLARSGERYDLMQMSMIDTWAATGAGAFSLSENGLYTVEGWRTFFDHLAPDGVLTVSRWFSPENIDETGRMMSLATATLLAEGITNPRDHLFLAAGKRLATLVLSRAPFTPGEVAALSAATTGRGFHVIVSPGQPVLSPALAAIAGARDRAALDALSSGYALDMSPSTDERPFFFNQLRLTDPGAWSLAMASPDGVARGNLLATVTLALIVLLSAGLVAATILGPSLGSVRQVAPAFAFYGTSYFLLIGLGFMFVEMGLIERLSVYLGHPVYGLAIGLGGIILSTGCGSLLAAKIKLSSAPRLALWAGLFRALSRAAAAVAGRACRALRGGGSGRADCDIAFGDRALGPAHGLGVPDRHGARQRDQFSPDAVVLGGERIGRRARRRPRRCGEHRRLDQHDAMGGRRLLPAGAGGDGAAAAGGAASLRRRYPWRVVRVARGRPG